ncbi:MAG TPA: DegT/DnrJ/EryC1/StrS family aminotransferase [Solirubrobacteraceae bacterium]|jgi:perosamine synthetase|nr:DegT/DnrJ/EryC1/StrS family aminotransferase [Solirubrobacteraceae bacterium]
MLRLAEPRFGADALEAIGRVLASGHLTQGPVVAEFEEAVAGFCGVRHGVATTSATTAIELALAALEIGPGDEVIAADFTYPATGNAVLQRGASLRLADADPATYCVDPAAVEALITPRTKAVLAVDVFGLPADYTALEPLLERHGIALVCDAACSLGGAIGERRCGAFGRAGCFSFHPRKSLTTGEGGMVVTDDDALAQRLRLLRNHGTQRDGWRATFVEPGFNYRMSDLNAALGLVQLPAHEETVRARNALAEQLTALLDGVEGVRPQHVPDGALHPYQAYVVTCDPSLDRDALIAALRERGVESTLGTYAMHAEPAFTAACGTAPGDLPASRALAERTLALPLHQALSAADMETVAEALDAAIRQLPAR